VVTRGVPEGTVRLEEGGRLVDLMHIKVERRMVLIGTHFNDAPDPEGVRLLCKHVGGSAAHYSEARITRNPARVTCLNCWMSLRMSARKPEAGRTEEL
jgi:hypothetical protein